MSGPHSNRLARLTAADRQSFVDTLSPKEAELLQFHWPFWARPEQIVPEGNWINWLIMAGRGFGKTRTGAETVRQWVKEYKYVNLIGATSDDVREIMVEGESGILAICPDDERPRYIANKRRLEWPNGAKSLLFSAEEPDRFRGKQHMKLWCDEMASWRYSDSWDQASLGLRLGDAPQVVITTTPRPIKMIKDLISDSKTLVTRGSTYDNSSNLAQAFIDRIVKRYEGTRQGRQELNAELLDDTPGAMWTRDMIEAARVRAAPHNLARIVIAVDPAVSNNPGSDETGIIAMGHGVDQHGYVLEDSSGKYSPNEWAIEAIRLYRKFRADRVVAEVNNGGDMVEAVLRNADPSVSFSAVHASRGKAIRAEPVAALYERRLVHHVGQFAKLEDQMCEFTTDFDRATAGYSPDRMDGLVWAATELMVEEGFNLATYLRAYA